MLSMAPATEDIDLTVAHEYHLYVADLMAVDDIVRLGDCSYLSEILATSRRWE